MNNQLATTIKKTRNEAWQCLVAISGFKSRTAALAWLRQQEFDFQPPAVPCHGTRTLSDCITRYKEEALAEKSHSAAISKLGHLEFWEREAGACFLRDIQPQMIVDLRSKLIAGGRRTKATANRYMSTLNHMLNMAVREWQWLDRSPTKGIRKFKEAPMRVRFLLDNERMRLLEACKTSSCPDLFDAVVLALCTGARQSEQMSLRWRDIDFERRLIRFERTKGGRPHAAPLSPTAEKTLCARLAKMDQSIDASFIFPSRKKPNQPIDLRRPWLNALRKAGIANFRWHDLRHTAASYLAMSGATTLEVAELLGHRCIGMTRRYAHLSQGHLFKTVAAMDKEFLNHA